MKLGLLEESDTQLSGDCFCYCLIEPIVIEVRNKTTHLDYDLSSFGESNTTWVVIVLTCGMAPKTSA